MVPDANPPGARSGADDETRLALIAADLADRIDATVADWISLLVVTRVEQWQGKASDEVRALADAAGNAARAELMPRMRRLLEADIDDQAANPLELLRHATRHAQSVLEGLGTPAVERDQFAQRSFPTDVYDLMPATWSDIDPSLHQPGITWGAAKAFVHKARRRAEGMA